MNEDSKSSDDNSETAFCKIHQDELYGLHMYSMFLDSSRGVRSVSTEFYFVLRIVHQSEFDLFSQESG